MPSLTEEEFKLYCEAMDVAADQIEAKRKALLDADVNIHTVKAEQEAFKYFKKQ